MIEDVVVCVRGLRQVATGGVNDALGLSGGPLAAGTSDQFSTSVNGVFRLGGEIAAANSVESG